MDQIEALQESLLNPMTALWLKLVAFTPNLISAILMLIAGYYLGRFVGFILRKFFARVGTDKLLDQTGLGAVFESIGVEKNISQILGLIGFWLIMLIFMVSAADTLGLSQVSRTINDFVLYLPKVIGAAFVVLIGLFLARFVRDSVQGVGETMQVEYAKELGIAIQVLLVVIVVSLAIGQLEIETGLLNRTVSIFLASIGIAVAISLGLGTRDISANVIAGVYARDLFASGSSVEIGDLKGKVVEVGTTKTSIKCAGKTVYISNRELIENTVEVKDAKKSAPAG